MAPEPEPESVADLEPQPEAAVDPEPEVVIAAEPELATEPEVMAEPEPAIESEPVTEPEVAAEAARDADAPAVATSGGSKSRRESKAKVRPAPAVPEEFVPEQVVPEQVLPVDELEAEIANIGDGQTVVAEYGAALDDLVSKYSFRKVEHWYELPGFDIPAPPDLGAPKEADEAAPGQDSTSEDI